MNSFFSPVGCTIQVAVAAFIAGAVVLNSISTPPTAPSHIVKILCKTDCYLRMRQAPTGIYLSGGVTMYFRLALEDKMAFARTHKDISNFVEFTVLDNQLNF